MTLASPSEPAVAASRWRQDALCAGDPYTWESTDPVDVQLALAGCARCPVLAPCEAELAELPPSRLDASVWAGKVVLASGRVSSRTPGPELGVACTHCGAAVGAHCRTKSGAKHAGHASRLKAWKAAQAAGIPVIVTTSKEAQNV